ncbi:hypothetical protein GNZ12_24085 [Paraburkholderia sp. 1N]|uniref:Uncharacterized protein n=2 Tax=Paraburkholderia TaxID=1822464 RepID=A0ABM8QT58_9BURK|nr:MULTISPECIES: hypothetical protein [Paraburkholderia]NPT44333.1 hypothetical protein [Paraburkholderia solitsugae]CAE6713773.1 hypothetical protein R69888_01274 [Paraburkholderia haematera]
MDAYSYLLLAYLGVLSIVFTVVVVLRIRFPTIRPLEPTQEHCEFIARRSRDLKSFK